MSFCEYLNQFFFEFDKNMINTKTFLLFFSFIILINADEVSDNLREFAASLPTGDTILGNSPKETLDAILLPILKGNIAFSQSVYQARPSDVNRVLLSPNFKKYILDKRNHLEEYATCKKSFEDCAEDFFNKFNENLDFVIEDFNRKSFVDGRSKLYNVENKAVVRYEKATKKCVLRALPKVNKRGITQRIIDSFFNCVAKANEALLNLVTEE